MSSPSDCLLRNDRLRRMPHHREFPTEDVRRGRVRHDTIDRPRGCYLRGHPSAARCLQQTRTVRE